MFKDKKLILINDVFASRKSLQFSKMIWQLIGSKVISMRLNLHEKVFCYLSHLPHLISFAMVNTVGEKKIKECFEDLQERVSTISHELQQVQQRCGWISSYQIKMN